MNYKLSTLIFILVLFSGCSSAPKYIVSTEWDESNLAEVFIYRTDVEYHSLNPEKLFFYIDGKKVGKLGTGQSIYTKITPGSHVVTVKESVLFMPAYENGSLTFSAEPNKKYYVRYSKDFSGIVVAGQSAVATGTTTLQMANEEYFKQRK